MKNFEVLLRLTFNPQVTFFSEYVMVCWHYLFKNMLLIVLSTIVIANYNAEGEYRLAGCIHGKFVFSFLIKYCHFFHCEKGRLWNPQLISHLVVKYWKLFCYNQDQVKDARFYHCHSVIHSSNQNNWTCYILKKISKLKRKK